MFFINWFVNILAIEFLALRPIKNIINVDEERDSKYHAFRRPDVKWFSRLWLYTWCHLALARLIFAFLMIGVSAIIINLAVFGTKKDEPITGLRYWVVRT